MSISQPDADRRLLPRWRASEATISTAELASTSTVQKEAEPDAHFEERKLEWEHGHSVEVAAELVASGIALGRLNEVEPAVRMLADNASDATPSIRAVARRALGERPTRPTESPRLRPERLDPTLIYSRISALRRHVHLHPRDAYAWVDLARLYTILGQTASAERAIRIAIRLAPEDRFVLRSAVRYFVHVEDPPAAQRLLNGARATRVDPWLIAAEIAVSQVANRRSLTASIGQRGLDHSQWTPRSSSELAGALGTLLLEDGATHKARQFFRRSLEDPTENAIAQAQWASQRTSGLVVPAPLFEQPTTYEAQALRARLDGHWEVAISSSWEWADFEPTSSRPLMMGSYVASVVYGDGATVLEFSERGLSAEPHHPGLLNNKAVGLAYLGRVSEAISILAKVAIDASPQFIQPALYATTGLLAFRAGDFATGRELYERAAAHPYTKRDRDVRILALWHLALEEALARTDQAEAAAARAERASKDTKLAEVAALRKRLVGAKSEAHGARSRH
ncbi:MAG: tetratricopeptide repeat protein [Steroidobacteraceae bacterium]